MSLLHEPFLVLDRSKKCVVYEADSLGQAIGYCEASEHLCMIATVTEANRSEWMYQIHLMGQSGQIVCSGPIVNVYDAEELLCDLRVVLLPVNFPENDKQHIPAEEMTLFDEKDWNDDDDEGEEWKKGGVL